MGPFWYFILLIGAVALGDEGISNVPGCGDSSTKMEESSSSAPNTTTETAPSRTTARNGTPPSTTTTPNETTTATATTKKGTVPEDQSKYGYYAENGCLHRVLLSHGRMYHATCTFLCQWSRRLHRVYDGKPCLRILEKRFQERQYTHSKVCRMGHCLRGICVPNGYVQQCEIPKNGPRLPQRPQSGPE
ncbi:uncharacterized protein LOC119179233 isoform X2 [Rhipicephalus microplus]|uniref:Evasin n=1 Tax=Rhipicephalus microplus TaxID=6941 RepID=A0A6G5A6Z2_RHIMP